MELREGVHDGLETEALSKTTPSRAIRSNVGVFTTGSPYTPA